jgi:hypothetical protein
MKVTFMEAFVAVVVLVGLAGCADAQFEGDAVTKPPSANTPVSPNLSPEIAGIHPTEASQACPQPQVGVDVRLTDAMRRNGTFDPSTVTLVLDGNDVTQKAKVLGTLEYPQGRITLLYTPATPLALGAHRVAFTYPAATGRKSYEWTFTVANIACP